MRRTAVAAALLAACLAPPARAAGPQIVDGTGDANYSREPGSTAPLSLPWFDITTVRWWADRKAQHLSVTFVDADPAVQAGYVFAIYDDGSLGADVFWYTGDDFATLARPVPLEGSRTYDAPVWSGDTLTFTFPLRTLPRWLAPGTTMTHFLASAGDYAEVGGTRAATHGADRAESTGRYVVGT